MEELSRANLPRDADAFDLWLMRLVQERYQKRPEDDAVPEDLLRLVCDSRSEWSEMKERWTAGTRRSVGSLD